MEGLFNEIKEAEVAILSWFDGEHRDFLADGLDDLRRLYSQMCEQLTKVYDDESS